ncbi:MAG: helix-turn-helix domain-containing protein, partial [Spirochaetaceae bacterium]|nr:helix-turn-helix domain-containing protein [Spirochaetaceae bacterium]
KQKYIPLCFRGKISIKQAAEKIGIKYNSVWRLKKRFSQHGEAIFIHGNTGRKPKNTRHDDNAIFDFYKKHFDGSPFMVCRDYYSRFCSAVSYSKVYRVLTSHNILSPRARVPKAELIAAHSPEAKGRVERMWQTLQGRLPWIFRFYGIDTIAKANDFLLTYIDEYNERFSVEAQKKGTKYHSENLTDYDFAVREQKKTKADGTFIYHSHVFRLDAPRCCRVRFELCLSERRGLWAVMDGKEYGVSLCEPIRDVRGGSMPYVEQDLITRFFLADTHERASVV